MKINRHEILITKYLTKEITLEEEKEFREWINADPKHRKIFEQKKQIWNVADFDEDYQPDLDEGMRMFHRKLNRSANKSGTSNLLKIAAVGFLVIAVSVAMYLLVFNAPCNVEITAANQMQIVRLPDGSKIWLKKGASITYLKDFETREINLKGEAFFDVESSASSPFIVHCRKNQITVLGTSFVVKEDAQYVSISVLTGKVALQNNHQKIILEEKESAWAERNTGEIKKLTNNEFPQMDWRKIDLFFSNQRLEDILKDLGEYFGVTFELKNKNLGNCRFTGNLKNKSLQSILKLLQVSVNLEIEEKPNHVFYLNGKSCS